MYSEDIAAELHKRPFTGLRIQMSDGSEIEVYHPELVLVGVGSVFVGTPQKVKPYSIISSYQILNVDHILRLEPITKAAAETN